VNLLATMFLGGLWHGASWTFVVWGTLHGVFLAANHLWNDLRERWKLPAPPEQGLFFCGKIGITFIAVTALWVFFRAPTFQVAENMLLAMTGTTGICLPTGLESVLRAPLQALQLKGVIFNSSFLLYPTSVDTPHLGAPKFAGLLALAMVIAFFFPNSQEIVARLEAFRPATPVRVALMHGAWGAALGLVFCFTLALSGRKSDFLYFQF
jgi:alginate O-acetyltransferase complex protein AlgI